MRKGTHSYDDSEVRPHHRPLVGASGSVVVRSAVALLVPVLLATSCYRTTTDGASDADEGSPDGADVGAGDSDARSEDIGEAWTDPDSLARLCRIPEFPACPVGLVCTQTSPPFCTDSYLGNCVAVPTDCTGEPEHQVCSCDGRRHRNECEARRDGVTTLLVPCADDACTGFAALASPEEIAATPRMDVDLERLALSTGHTFTANQAIYDRIVDDVTRIRSAAPEVADISYGGRYDRELEIAVDLPTVDAIESGTYSAWTCLNEYYGMTSFSTQRFPTLAQYFVDMAFAGVLELRALAVEYSELPGMLRGSPASVAGDGSTICVARDGETYHYVFDVGSGDCPEGCTAHVYYYFWTRAAGSEPNRGGVWDNTSGEPPDWAARLTPCP